MTVENNTFLRIPEWTKTENAARIIKFFFDPHFHCNTLSRIVKIAPQEQFAPAGGMPSLSSESGHGKGLLPSIKALENYRAVSRAYLLTGNL